MDEQADDAPGETTRLLSDEERESLSARRIQVRMVAVTVGLLGLMVGLIFILVTQIFATLTPPLQRDLEQKALRGASLLSRELDLGLLTEDRDLIASAARDYVADSDVLAIVAITPDGREVYRHGRADGAARTPFEGPARTLRQRDGELVAWSEVRLESVIAGKVALVVSTERIAAGDRLRLRILAVAAVGGLLAFVAALLFVSLYVGPILRIVHATIRRLEQTTQHALEATRLKSEFLANMSHEIRTPMNGVLAMSDLLLRSPLEERQQRFAEIIRTSARSLLTIVDDVLDFSKIEAGKYELSMGSLDLRMSVRDVVELLAPRAQGKGIELAYQVAPDVPRLVETDADRFRQVITNLVGNAVKFTEHGQVVITIEQRTRVGQRAQLACCVRDSGPGISVAGQAMLFNSFTQVDGSSTRQHGGTGLGLVISQRLARLLGGDITLESELGKGSTFCFTLDCGVLEEASAPGAHFAALGKRALLVDDNEACRSLLAEQLTRWGLLHESVGSALDAMLCLEQAIMEARPFEVVFVAEHLAAGGAVELASAVQKSVVPTAVALIAGSGGLDSRSTPIPEDLPVLTKPLRESDVFDFLMRAFHVADNQNELAPSSSRRISSPARGGHVLAVDDNEINQTVALELLQELGYTVDIASNGQQALEAVQRGGYHAVLMDCQMPVMDGYQATREIRAFEADNSRPRVPIIALTAHAIAGERERVLAAGMDDYLTKPIVGAALERALLRHVLVEQASESPARMRRQNQTTARSKRITSSEPPLAVSIVEGPEQARARPTLPDLLDPSVRRSAKVSQLFLELVPAQIEGLLAAARDESREQLKARAHKLKGGCASVGAAPLAALCAELEKAAARGDFARARQQAEALFGLFEATAASLRAEAERGVRAS